MPAPPTSAILPLAMLACMAACSHAWDDLDPRLTGSGGASGVGGATSSTTGSMGGSGSGGMTSVSSSGQGGSGGSTSAAGGSGGAIDFIDDFDRADDPGIGNGWIEKTPDAFSLVGFRAVKVAAGGSYRQNLVYRPMNEMLLDVEASVEVEFTTATIQRPQLFVRAKWADITLADGYVGYKVWIDGSATSAQLSIQPGAGGSNLLQAITIAPALVQGERYRMRLRAEGTNPVMLEAWVEHFSNNMWVTVGHATHSDTTPGRIDTAGTMGFAGSSATGYYMDNYRYSAL